MNQPPKTVFNFWCEKYFLLLIFFAFFSFGKMSGQGCECVGCNGNIPISSTTTYTLTVSGATNDDLSNANQGVCGVFIDVSFEHIWSLTITLTSPDGQVITLIGPYDNFPGTTSFSNWDIGFLPCADPVTPDLMPNGVPFTDQWSNLQQWGIFTNYTGSYYPYIGCLEDFNSGTVNGDWTIEVVNGSGFYGSGTFNGFSILFCDETGTGCADCDANAGDLSVVDDIDLCVDDNFTGSIDPFYTFGSEPNNQYSYTYIISQNSIIQSYDDNPEISNFSMGTYEICGLSYLTADVGNIPSPNGVMSVSDLENMLSTSPPFCGDISDDCFEVTIYPTVNDVVVNDVFCDGDTYTYRGNDFTTGGMYNLTLTSSFACDTMVELNLTTLPASSENIDSIICQGDTVFIGNDFYEATGNYSSTLMSVNGCDSVINLNLTVLNPTAEIDPPMMISCDDLEIELDGSSSSSGNDVNYLWTTSGGSINGSNTDNTVIVDEAGKYFLTVIISENGITCTDIDSVEVTSTVNYPMVEAGVDSVLDCSVTSIVLDGSGSSVGTNFSYEWTTATGNIVQDTFTLQPTIDSEGTYILSVTNMDNNCVAQDSVLIIENVILPTTDAGNDMALTCSQTVLQLDGTASSQGTPYVYQWTTVNGNILLGENTLEPTVDSTGTYQLIVTDTFNQCTSTDLVEVMIDTIAPIADVGNDFTLNCLTPEAQIDGSNSSQGSDFSFQWNVLSGASFVNGTNTLMPTVNGTGEYELVVTNDLTGCSSNAQVAVNQDFVQPSIMIEMPIDTITCMTSLVEIDAGDSSNAGDFTYQWTVVGDGNIQSGANSLFPQINEAGTFELEITNNQNGCTNTETVEVFADTIPPVANAGEDMVINCNQFQVMLNGSGSVGGEFMVLWTEINGGNIFSGENTLTPTVDETGIYEILISNTQNGCVQTDTATVTVDTIPPIADAGLDTLLNCFFPTIELNGTGSSSGDFSYLWTTSSGGTVLNETSLQPTISTSGDYEILVTNNQNGCSAVDSIFVGENLNPPIAMAGMDTVVTCAIPIISLNGNGSSFGSEFTYLWIASNGGHIISGEASLQPLIDSSGTYQLTVSNAMNGCTATDEVIVVANNIPPIADAGMPDTINCEQSVLTLDGTASSSGNDIVYFWSTMDGNILLGELTTQPQVDSAGVYTLTVGNTSNGCAAQSDVLITIDTTAVIADAGEDMLLNCLASEVDLDGTNSSVGNEFSYTWTTNGGNFILGQNSIQPTVNQVGTYYLEVENDINGCAAIDSVFVTGNFNQPIADAGVDTVLDCTNLTIILDGTNSSSGINEVYQWTALNGGFIMNGATTLQPEIGEVGDYELIITDTLSGCMASDEVSVSINTAPPLASVIPNASITCDEPIVTLDGTASTMGSQIIYSWRTIDGNVVAGANTMTPQVDTSGVYFLEVIDTLNGCSDENFVIVTFDTLAPIANAGFDTSLTCNSIVIELDGTGTTQGNNNVYTWTTSGVSNITNPNSLTPQIDSAGIFELQVLDTLNGCFATDEVEVVWDTIAPVADAGVDTILDCNISSVVLGGNSSIGNQFDYAWTFSAGGNIISNTNEPTATVDSSATYFLTIINTENGCVATDEVEVTQDITLPIAMTVSSDTLPCAGGNIILDGSGSSLGANFIYEWTTGNGNIVADTFTLFPTVDATGIYILTVTNITNNCTSTGFVEVLLENCAPVAIAGSDGMIDCNQPTLTLDGTGSSVGDYSYEWTTPTGNILADTFTLFPTVDAAGIYVLTVTNNATGLIAVDSVEVVSLIDFPTITLSVNELLGCVNTSVLVDGVGSSLGVPFEYEWTTTNGNITSINSDQTITVSVAAMYFLAITDTLNGCAAIDSIEVLQDIDVPMADAGLDLELNCYNNQLNLDGSASSVGNNFTYSWTTSDGNILFGENSLTPLVDSGGAYFLLVTNTTNGCTQLDSMQVSENFIEPIANAGVTDTIDCNNTITSLDGSGSSVGSTFIYSWQTSDGNIFLGENTLTPQIDLGGAFELTVLDTLNGCSAIDSVSVFQNTNAPVADAGMNATIDCGVASIILDGTNSSMGSEFSYLWTTSTGNILNNNNTLTPEISSDGTYILTIENNENGCTAIDSVTILGSTCIPIASILSPDTLTCVVTEITLDGSASSDWASMIFEWTTTNGNIVGATNTLFATVNQAGDYKLILTDTLTNEMDSTIVTVIADENLPIANAGQPDTLNCGIMELTLDGSASSVGNNFTYVWTTNDGNIESGADGIFPLINQDGIYELQVTDIGNGCTSTASVAIEIDTILPVADAGNFMEITCVNTLLQLDGSASSTGNNFTYEWNTLDGNIVGDNNILTPSVDSNGTYQIIVLNSQNLCRDSAEVLVGIDTIAPSIFIAPSLDLTCTMTEIQLDASNSSTGNNFSYQWNTTTGNILNGELSLTPLIDKGGDYELVISDSENGCTSMEIISVFQDTLIPISNAGNSVELTCVDTLLSLDGSASSVGNEFSYQWNTTDGNIVDQGNSLFPNINAVGTYELVVTNTTNNCTAVSEVEVTQDITPPIIDIVQPDTLNCAIENITINAQNSSNGLNFNYLWITNDGDIDFGELTLSPQVSDGGTYELTISNSENGCTSVASIEVMQDTLVPIAAAGMEMTLTCVDTVIMLDGSSSSTGNEFAYQWNTTGGNVLLGENTLTPTVDALGVYELEILNQNNQCTAIDSVEVFENITPPIIEINAIGGLILNCNVSSIVLDGSGSTPIGNVSFEWTTPNGNILLGNNTPNPEVDLLGEYNLTLTNDVNGCTATEMVEIFSDFETPEINILTPEILTCVDTVITLDGTGSSVGNNIMYTWSTSNGNILSGVNDLSSEVNQPGEYILMVLNTNNGCSIEEGIFVLQNIIAPFADAGGAYEFDCIETEMTLNATASQGTEFTYLWNTANGNVLLGNTTLEPTVDAVGLYVLTVANQENGCTATSEAIVTEDLDTPQDMELLISPPLCHGDFNGSIEVLNVQGGEAPYLFSLNNQPFSSNSIFSNLVGGIYTINVQDADGCELIIEINLPDPVEVSVTLGEDIPIALGDSTNLQAITNIPFNNLDTVIWTSTGEVDCVNCLEPNVMPFVTTTYSVLVMNENGCIAEDKVTVYVDNQRRLYIPNAFSPNDDGYNDVFMIYGGLGVEEIETFQIFSRWGELVFEKNNFHPNDTSSGWDGYFNGKKMNPNVFVYFAKVKYLNGKTEVIKGDLYLK